ncbi:MAG: trigger factor [Synergistaceae bacterium]|jgi:trigger factor|nr:trigger factor [Synergistaceae bacterium]
MKTELLGQEKNIVKIKLEFEAEEFASSLDRTVQEFAQKANVPGFRKGHISRKILEMRLGKESLYAEAFEKMLPKAIEQIEGDYDLETIDTPSLNVDFGSIQEGQPLACELTFEVAPAISLPEIEEIEVERQRCPEVEDEILDGMIAKYRGDCSTLVPVDRAAADGDVVFVSHVAQVFGDEGEQLAVEEAQDSDIDLQETLRSEIREALLGKKKGDEAEAEFEVEADHENAAIAGKRFRYTFIVKEVQERILPEMGPEFYRKVMGAELETEDEFREELKRRFIEFMTNDIQTRLVDAAVKEVVSKSELEVPDTLVKREMEHQRKHDISEAEERFKLSMEEYLHRSSISPATYEQNLRESAEKRVRNTLVLEEVGSKFGVTVEMDELAAEIARLAVVYNIELARMKAILHKDENRVAQMVKELRYNKIARLIAEKVKVKDSDKPFLMLEEAAEEEAAEGEEE